MSVDDIVEVRPPHKRRSVKGKVTSIVERGFFYRDADQKEHFALNGWVVVPKTKKLRAGKK